MPPHLRSQIVKNRYTNASPTDHPVQAVANSEIASSPFNQASHNIDGEDTKGHSCDQHVISLYEERLNDLEELPDATDTNTEVLTQTSESGNVTEQTNLSTGDTNRRISSKSVTQPQDKSKATVKPQNKLKPDVETWKYKNGLCTDLPPICEADDIIAEIASKSIDSGLRGVIDYLDGHILRVATLCSGTESPILFLREFSAALASKNLTLQFEHVFSAEIEPFKQAYIERNFHPPLLFRDITQFMRVAEPETAFGTRAKLPRDIDLLIAGFSCVDFSRLNAHKKSLNDDGQSGQTAHGVLRYAKETQVPIVILENVDGAPWTQIGEIWGEAGYATSHIKVDTKNYYIPQTRQRGYMLCVFKGKTSGKAEASKILRTWEHKMGEFKRPASTPFHAFLLDPDDPRLHKAQAEYKGSQTNKREVAWVRYEARHIEYRNLNSFGHGRPITEWRPNGSSKMVEFGNRLWMLHQVERVKDTLDIASLRCATRGYDLHSKSVVIDFSQGADRVTDKTPAGLVGCLTPLGMPYYTLRGGLVTGIEALRLQGIPTNGLSLTRETQRELQNMAGNAMSTPAVGVAIVSSLIAALKTLPRGSNNTKKLLSLPSTNESRCYEIKDDVADSQLQEQHISTHEFKAVRLKELKRLAAETVSQCLCEGSTGASNLNILVCSGCGHTACKNCRGTPYHDFEGITLSSRSNPFMFKTMIKSVLPMRLVLHSFIEDVNLQVKDGSPLGVYLQTLKALAQDELSFSEVKRTQVWTAVYISVSSRLEFRVSPSCCEWVYFAIPRKEWAYNDKQRELLRNPVARMFVKGDDLLAGQWDFRWPVTEGLDIILNQKEDVTRIPSWRSKLGIPKYANDRVPMEITVTTYGCLPEIEGLYVHLPQCGTACACLYVRRLPTKNPMYLFLDPDFLGHPEEDRFVFSQDCKRLVHGQIRHIVASIGPNRDFTQWLLTNVNQQLFHGRIEQLWLRTTAKLTEVEEKVFVKTPAQDFDILQNLCITNSKRCSGKLTPVLTCAVPHVVTKRGAWREGPWLELTETWEHDVFTSVAWITSRCAELGAMFNERRTLSVGELGTDCQACAPRPARLRWKPKLLGYQPFEDPRDASKYESAIKARPKGIVAMTRKDQSGQAHLLIGIHVPTLAHRALASLLVTPLMGNAASHDTRVFHEELEVSWRLNTSYDSDFDVPRQKFILPNNDDDPELMHVFENAIQEESAGKGMLKNDSSYNVGDSDDITIACSSDEIWPPRLRPEQARSLHWMLSQEDPHAEPFAEEETEEAYFVPLGWLLDVRATRRKKVWGGVVADGVGYGKTITTLALIEHQKIHQPLEACDGRIPLRATLILVTAGTLPQWESEAKKFLGKDMKVLVIKDLIRLKGYSVGQLKLAEIIIAPYPLITGASYLNRLALFAALPLPPDTQRGRPFVTWLQSTIARTKDHIAELSASKFPRNFGDKLRERQENAEVDEELHELVPCKGGIRDRADKEQSIDQAQQEGKISTKRKRNAKETKYSRKTPRQSVTETDAFHLNTARSLDDLLGPLFEMLEFQRIVVDEFTYLDEKDRASINSLVAPRKWILSGTPPLEDFADVKRMASFLGVHLGRDDIDKSAMTARNIRGLQKEQTEVEKFRYYAETHSWNWHLRRQELAQAFLNQFVRKNMSSVKLPRATEVLRILNLTLAERAIYTELEAWLVGKDMKVRAMKKVKYMNDRDVRIHKALDITKSGELGLLYAASRVELDASQTNFIGAEADLRFLLELRSKHLLELRKAMMSIFLWTKKLKAQGDGDTHYENWITTIKSNEYEDKDTQDIIKEIVSAAEAELETHSQMDTKALVTKAMEYLQHIICFDTEDIAKRFSPEDIQVDHSHKRLKTLNEKLARPASDHKLVLLRELTPHLASLATQYVHGLRAFRYLNTIGFLQATDAKGHRAIMLNCGHLAQCSSEIYVLYMCGHTICKRCSATKPQELALPEIAESESVMEAAAPVLEGAPCPVKGCRAQMTDSRPANEYGVINNVLSGPKCYRGSKIEAIVNLITNEIPVNDQVIVFVQIDHVMTAIGNALREQSVEYRCISESIARSARAGEHIKEFRQSHKRVKLIRVLLLNSANESCAGSNLQNANHVVFVSPLHANSDYDYSASETQCLGRASRQGQKRRVNLYRFLTLRTIDIDILEARMSKKVVQSDSGEWALKDEDELNIKEKEQNWGTVVGRNYLPDLMNRGDEED